MNDGKSPGVTRENRLSDEGLIRLEKQLVSGARMSTIVLDQWVKRYGEAAIAILHKHGQIYPESNKDD